MIRLDRKTWHDSVAEFLETRTGRALAWGIPALAAVAVVLGGLWWGMRR